MGTLTGLSGEYVTYDHNGQNCNFGWLPLTWRIGSFRGLAVLFRRLDES